MCYRSFCFRLSKGKNGRRGELPLAGHLEGEGGEEHCYTLGGVNAVQLKQKKYRLSILYRPLLGLSHQTVRIIPMYHPGIKAITTMAVKAGC